MPTGYIGSALTALIAIMTFLASITTGTVLLVSASAADWQSEVASEITVRADDTEFRATLRLDTPREREYLRHGGILPYVLRQLVLRAPPNLVEGFGVGAIRESFNALGSLSDPQSPINRWLQELLGRDVLSSAEAARLSPEVFQ